MEYFVEFFKSLKNNGINDNNIKKFKRILLSHKFYIYKEILNMKYLKCKECNFDVSVPQNCRDFRKFTSIEDFIDAGFISCGDYIIREIIE